MSKVQNLHDKEAVDKIYSIVKASNTCMFATSLDHRPLPARPMATVDVDKEGNLWFFSERSSDKNSEIHLNHEVQLFYCNQGKDEYLTIYGEAETVQDKALINKLWKPAAQAFVRVAKDSPELTLIKVHPLEAYYWDTKNNKMVTVLKNIAGTLIGKPLDIVIEGKVNTDH